MHAIDPSTGTVLRHGAYLCLALPAATREGALAARIPDLILGLRLANEFDAREGHPPGAYAFLRRAGVQPGTLRHPLETADAVVHAASAVCEAIDEFVDEGTRLLDEAGVGVSLLRGVVRPREYTSAAMERYAYAHQAPQVDGTTMPEAFLVPLKKTPAWWAKDWMERHTYFLPRYDASGHMTAQGHALAAEAGIPVLMRRTYKNVDEPAPGDAFDSVNYFECATADVPTFHAVCDALRDTKRNPEWAFVCEGPTWHGRRVRTWDELVAP